MYKTRASTIYIIKLNASCMLWKSLICIILMSVDFIFQHNIFLLIFVLLLKIDELNEYIHILYPLLVKLIVLF